MQYQDYYLILGVPRDATDKDIKAAYRQLARRYHPDLNTSPEAAARFRQINEAYQVLADAAKRAQYDRLDMSYRTWRGAGGVGDFDWGRWTRENQTPRYEEALFEDNDEGGRGVMSDFFRAIFGDPQRPAPSSARRSSPKAAINGRDLELEVSMTLEEVAEGTVRLINLPDGRSFSARLPRGARTGTRVKFAGQGESGFAGGSSGTLYLTIQVQDHPLFERQDDDLYLDLPVPLYTAVLGGEVLLPTLNGQVKLKIPSGTQAGKLIRLKGRGLPPLGAQDLNERGDLYVRVEILIPTDLSPEERGLFERLAALRPHAVY
jgi:curved DNA-binding protein